MAQITPSQLRAARALLNWRRVDLAKFSGISAPTIHRFENGENKPEERTTNKLIEVFYKHGVEFSENQGVRFRPNNVDVYDGVERFGEFYDFLYEQLCQFGGDVCVSIQNETLLYHYPEKDPDSHMKRMKRLYDQRKLLSFRIITTISEFNTYGYATFRWLPNKPPSPTCFYAFGDCLAVISLIDISNPHIVVIRSGPLADSYRYDFNVTWKLAQKPPSAAIIAKMLSKEGGAPFLSEKKEEISFR